MVSIQDQIAEHQKSIVLHKKMIGMLLSKFAEEVTDLRVGDLVRDPAVKGWAEVATITAYSTAIGPMIEIVFLGRLTLDTTYFFTGVWVSRPDDPGPVAWCEDYEYGWFVRRYTDISKVPKKPKRGPRDEARVREQISSELRFAARGGYTIER